MCRKWIVSDLILEHGTEDLEPILKEDPGCRYRFRSGFLVPELLRSFKGAFVYGPFHFVRMVSLQLDNDVCFPLDVDRLKYSKTVELFDNDLLLNQTRLYTTWEQLLQGDLDYSKTKGRALDGEWAEPPFEKVFVRSDSVTKTLPGQVVGTDGYDYRALCDVTSVMPPTPIVLCPPVNGIRAEYRLVVIDDQIVTWSRYMQRGQVSVAGPATIPLESVAHVLDAAQDFVPVLSDHMAGMPYTLDVADMGSCLVRVIEVNSLNCAGWYACDVRKIVKAVNRHMG